MFYENSQEIFCLVCFWELCKIIQALLNCWQQELIFTFVGFHLFIQLIDYRSSEPNMGSFKSYDIL